MQQRFKRIFVSQGQKGFSFLEIIFALTILSFGLVGFLTLFSEMLRSTVDDEFTMTGSHLAVQKLEKILADKAALGYVNISTGVTVENIDYGGHSFTRQTSIGWVNSVDLKTPSGTDTGFKRIDVVVSWTNGDLKQVQMMSLISSY